MTRSVFIDGEAGTTGLLIRDRLQSREDIRLISLADDKRKDIEARKAAMNSADAVILCLPDDAAREAVTLVENEAIIIDASTAHRVDPDWVYGFPEMGKDQRELLRKSKRISNPGCYATGFIALVRPLVEAGLIAPYFPVHCHGVSGYTGGGKAMIADFEKPESDAYRLYATHLNHKHIPEMTVYSGLDSPPLFTPAVGKFPRGMVVEIGLSLWALPNEPDIATIHQALADQYDSEPMVEVASLEACDATHALDARMLANSNRMKLFVFGDVEAQQARLVAVLDNLGKGASGAMVQNLNLVLGFEETTGLL